MNHAIYLSKAHHSQKCGIRVTALNVGGEGGRGGMERVKERDSSRSQMKRRTSQELVEVTTDSSDEKPRGAGVNEVKKSNNFFQRLGWE